MIIVEDRVITINIPVKVGAFEDDKEIIDLFKDVFENSVLYKNYHTKNTFYRIHEFAKIEYKFVITLHANDSDYDKRKSELIDLVHDYERVEEEYLRFKKYGCIETMGKIRKMSK